AGADSRERGRATSVSRPRGCALSEALLDARGLHVYYGASHVLHGVDFRVGEGEAVGLMGRNGMGKTTLLKALLGLVPPRKGDVQLRGKSVTGVASWRIARSGVALVPEGRGIFPNLDERENLWMAARQGSNGRGDWTYERVLTIFP